MSKHYKYILFDLDGTLTDSVLGVISGFSYVIKKMGREVPDESVLRKFVGPPLIVSFGKHLGYPPEQAEKAVEYYRSVYSGGEMFKCRPYPGVYDCIASLKGCGAKIFTGTSKPEQYTVKLLEHHGLLYLFDRVYGADPAQGRYRKKDVLEYALASCGIRDKSRAVLVGDTKYDIIGAKEVGIDTVGVLYGFGTREELELYGADHVADTARDISQYILNK